MLTKLKQIRDSRYMSQHELAVAAGICNAAYISTLEACKHNPHPRTVRRLAEALDVEPAELYGAPEKVA